MNWSWFFIRVAGLSGYFFLTLSIVVAILRHLPRKNKGHFLEFHQIIGQIGLLCMGVHAYLLLFDHYQPMSLIEVFVPFMSSYEPFLSGLGTIAAYLLLIVILTSDFMKKIGRPIWRKTHYLVFPLWLLSLVHGLFLGTDSPTIWAQWLYGGSFLCVAASTIFLAIKLTNKNRHSSLVHEKG